MNAADFSVFYDAARALLTGSDPYSVHVGVNGFYYPQVFLLLVLPFALLPYLAAFGLWTALSLMALIREFRQGFWKWLLFVPLVYCLDAGQSELLWWLLARHLKTGWRSAFFATLITLKPQAAVILLPYHLIRWWKGDRRTLARFSACAALLWGLPFLVWPEWGERWWTALDLSHHAALGSAPGLWSLTTLSPALIVPLGLLGGMILMWGLSQSEALMRACLILSSPVGLFYGALALMDTAPWWLLAALSWLAMGVTVVLKTWIGWAMIPVGVVLWWASCRHKNTSARPRVIQESLRQL